MLHGFRLTLVVALIGFASSSIANECDQTAAKVSAAVPNLTFIRRSDNKATETTEVHFKHPFSGTVEIICPPGLRPAVTIDTATVFPAQEFFDMIAKAGAAEAGLMASTVRSAFVRCHQTAMKSGGENFDIKGAEIGCSVLRDKPELTNFEIRRK